MSLTAKECAMIERIAGLGAAAVICSVALITDGPETALAAVGVAGACAAVGTYLGARTHA